LNTQIKLIDILQKTGIDRRDRSLIWNLYNALAAHDQTRDNFSSAYKMGRGVRQDCSLSNLLYVIYDEAMTKEGFADTEYVHHGP